MTFRSLDELVEAATGLGPTRIAVVAGHDQDAIEALDDARGIGLAHGVFVGDTNRIHAAAGKAGVNIAREWIIDEPDDASAAQRAMSLVRDGQADLLMKGKIGTSVLIRAVLDRESGLRTDRLLSQVIVFQMPSVNRLMLMTDAAINVAPTLEQKADICRNAIAVARAIGIDQPNVALLCALELVTADMPATVDAAALTQMNRRGQIADAYVEGPIALDAVLSTFAAERKGIQGPLVEGTDILIAPNIEAANILYRAIVYFGGGESGGVVVGARVPLVLLSRAETPQTKLRSIAIAVLTAESMKTVARA